MPTERCWCGKELFEVELCACPTDQQRLSDRRECPTHGENWRWRECGYAGKERHVSGGWLRYCSLSARFNEAHVPDEMWSEDCASCPIPAKGELIEKLVEAVEAWGEVEAHERECETCARMGPEETTCEASYKLSIWADRKRRAALAAHEKAQKEAAS